jgi:hypothetical protein
VKDDAVKLAVRLIREGKSDEEIENATGLSLVAIIGLRARAATPQPELN